MSLDAISAARKITGIRPREKFVLMALADYANDDDKAWPKQSTLAEWTCLNRKTINEALQELERLGFIESKQMYRADGGKSHKVYTLTFVGTPPHVTESYKGMSPRVTRDVTESYSKNPQENHQEIEPSSKTITEQEPILGVEVPSSAKGLRNLQLLGDIAEAWNENCGTMPKLRNNTIPRAYVKNAQRFIEDCKAEDIDPVEAMTIVAKQVQEIDWYRDKGGFGNVVAGGNWRKHYDSGLTRSAPAAVVIDVSPGEVVRWEKTMGQPKLGYEYGEVTRVDGDQVFVYKVTPRDDRVAYVQVDREVRAPLAGLEIVLRWPTMLVSSPVR